MGWMDVQFKMDMRESPRTLARACSPSPVLCVLVPLLVTQHSEQGVLSLGSERTRQSACLGTAGTGIETVGPPGGARGLASSKYQCCPTDTNASPVGKLQFLAATLKSEKKLMK